MKGFSDHFNKAPVKLVSEKTAVIVVDLVNDFMKEGGSMVLGGGMAVVPPIQKIVDAVKKKGGKVVYIKDNHRPDKTDAEFLIREPHCIDGTWGAELIDELSPEADDFILKKRRFSSFFQTDLDMILRENGIETLIVVGVVTNICVRSTVHDGFFNGYRCIVPEECVMATGEREQASSLWDIDTHFGYVMKTDEVIKLIG
ncbi:MAG: cysteine hydrolase [Planctomycetaceae bacterium]|nr:cysteine hydrolase [Planctomycetaceae bacterium]